MLGGMAAWAYTAAASVYAVRRRSRSKSPVSSGQRSSGQTSVICSLTCWSYASPNSVKIERGWSRSVGSSPSRGVDR